MRSFVILLSAILLLGIQAENSTLDEFTSANNLFTSDVYKQLLKTKTGNFLVSPFSAEIALAFVQAGAEDKTGQEIRQALHLPDDKTKIESAVKAVLPKVKSSDLYTLHTANKMYVKENFYINEDFKRVSSKVYNAETENIDFVKKTEAAETMNSWVEEHTENKIQKLISPADLNNRTRGVIINALYFKSNWSEPFMLTDTRKATFYKTARDTIQVDTMHSRYLSVYNYFECPHLKAKFLELPFKNNDASMIIILPNEREGLAALESQIDKALLPHNLTSQFVDVALPRFKIETEIDFKEILKNVGIEKVFDKNEADLSGIAGQKGDLIVDKVKQKTFIDVNEEGVEAAAATFVLYGVPEMALPDPPKQFIADHPFIFYIKLNNIIIFAGRVILPNY